MSEKSKRPVSARQIRANRRNAKKSTGPRTPEGKTISSRNAIAHGMYAADNHVLPGESHTTFLSLRDDLVRDYKPTDAAELMLVDRIVNAKWKLERLARLEQQLHADELSRMQGRLAGRLARVEQLLDEQSIDYSNWYKDHLDGTEFEEDDEGRKPNDDLKLMDEKELHETAEGAIDWLEMARQQRIPVERVQASQLSNAQRAREFERMSLMEQRLENSMYRAMRELDRLRRARKRDKPQYEDEADVQVPQVAPYELNPRELFHRGQRELKQVHDKMAQLKQTHGRVQAMHQRAREASNPPNEAADPPPPTTSWPDKHLPQSAPPPPGQSDASDS